MSKLDGLLQPGVTGREVWSWASFDFANSAYTTVILTAVYNAYFVSVVAGDAVWAPFCWTVVITLSNLVSMALIPSVSAAADEHACKKRFLAASTIICCVSTALLAFTGAGSIVLAGILIIASNAAFNCGVSLNSAFLSEIAQPNAQGRVSGWGWSFGYLGGILSLAICLVIVKASEAAGLAASFFVPACCVATAVFFAIFATPMQLWVKERSQASLRASESLKALLGQSLSLLKRSREFARLVLCGLLYQAGIMVVITLSAVYATGEMGFSAAETIVLILVVNFTAAAGAFAFGYLQDAIGHKATLALTLLIWLACVLIAAVAHSALLFWISANLAGLAMGSSQSAGRAATALFAEPGQLATYYSVWNASTWIAAVIGPLSYGAVTWLAAGNQRIAILMTGLYFVFGLVVLARIKFPAKH